MPAVVHQVTANNYARCYTYKRIAEAQGWKNELLTNFNCQIKTTSVWRKQGALSVSTLTAGCATHRAHCQASDRRLHSPLGKPQTPQKKKIRCLSPGQQNYQAQLHRTTPYHCRQQRRRSQGGRGGYRPPPNAKLGGVSPPKCTCAEIARIAYGGNYRTPNVLKLRPPSRSAPRTLFLCYIHPHFIPTGPDARRNCTRVAYGANYRTPNVQKLRPPSRSAPRSAISIPIPFHTRPTRL